MRVHHAGTFGPMAVHIGEEVLRRLEQVGMTKARFADRIGRHRGRVYDVFTSPGCDTVLLRKISQVLEFNFFKLLAEDLEPSSTKHEVGEPAVQYQRSAPGRQPIRLVIEVDPEDLQATTKAERMVTRIIESSKPKRGAAKK